MTAAGLSIREAARLFAVSRPTLAKWIRVGKISAAKSDNGDWLINPSEMIRLGIASRPTSELEVHNLPRSKVADMSTIAGQNVDNTGQEIATLKAMLAEAEQRAAVAEALADERAARIEDLRRMLPKPNLAQSASPSLWQRMFRRG